MVHHIQYTEATVMLNDDYDVIMIKIKTSKIYSNTFTLWSLAIN